MEGVRDRDRDKNIDTDRETVSSKLDRLCV